MSRAAAVFGSLHPVLALRAERPDMKQGIFGSLQGPSGATFAQGIAAGFERSQPKMPARPLASTAFCRSIADSSAIRARSPHPRVRKAFCGRCSEIQSRPRPYRSHNSRRCFPWMHGPYRACTAASCLNRF